MSYSVIVVPIAQPVVSNSVAICSGEKTPLSANGGNTIEWTPTVGLNVGTGRPESPRKQDLRKLTQYLPIIETAANQEGAPATLSTFVKYLRSL
jgi:hypothetical protein